MKKWPSIGVDKQKCGEEQLIRKANGKLRTLQKNGQAKPLRRATKQAVGHKRCGQAMVWRGKNSQPGKQVETSSPLAVPMNSKGPPVK
jgi:hypothetical protein